MLQLQELLMVSEVGDVRMLNKEWQLRVKHIVKDTICKWGRLNEKKKKVFEEGCSNLMEK